MCVPFMKLCMGNVTRLLGVHRLPSSKLQLTTIHARLGKKGYIGYWECDTPFFHAELLGHSSTVFHLYGTSIRTVIPIIPGEMWYLSGPEYDCEFDPPHDT